MLHIAEKQHQEILGYWSSQKPISIRRLIDGRSLDSLSVEDILAVLAPPAYSEFAILGKDEVATWYPNSVELTLPALQRFRARGQLSSLLIMNLQEAYSGLSRLFAEIVDLPHWRACRLGLSLSDATAVYPLHADDCDVFIVQVRGRRHWRVWSAETGNIREALIAKKSGRHMQHSDLQQDTPIVDTSLEPGDVLFIPAFCPHEVHSVEAEKGSAVSLSFTHRIVTAYDILMALPDNEVGSSTGLADGLFDPIPDPGRNTSPATWYADRIQQGLDLDRTIAENAVATFLKQLIS